MRHWIASFLIGLVALLQAAEPGAAERRVALVVGNSKYLAAGLELANPRNDSQDVATALRDLGFEVIHKGDVTKRDFDATLQSFARLAAGADSALFFYAGHAMQYQGRNYLVPIDAELDDEISIRYQTVALDDVRAALDQVTGVKIVILDACRNNPLANRLNRAMAGSNRAVGALRGLARIDKTQGMVVAYATSADDVALDGEGRNSPFTGALVRRMQEPGLEIEMMFRRITADVNTETRGRQRPETYISLLNEYYLNQSDVRAWERIKDSADVPALREFIARFPSSTRALDAKYRLDLLERLAGERKAEQQRRETARQNAEEDAARQREAQERARLEEAARARQQAERDAERQRVARAAEQAKAAEEAAESARLAAAAQALAEQEMARVQAAAQPVVTPDAIRERQLAAAETAAAKPASDPASFALASAAPASAQPDAAVSTPRKPDPIAIDPILDIQLELSRLGCLTSPASGVPDAATRSAVRNFASHVHDGLTTLDLNADLLTRLRTHEERVCPPQCHKGQVADGDRCVAAREPPRTKSARPAPPRIANRSGEPKTRRAATPAAPPPQPSAFKSATSPGRPIVGVGF
jgi:uncharacterized caspase-like protein